MPFEEFSLKNWKIIYTDDPDGEFPVGETVKIFRTEKGEVRIECKGEGSYTDVSYDGDRNTITAKGHVIRLGIVCTRNLGGGVSGGTWIAQDNPSGPPE